MFSVTNVTLETLTSDLAKQFADMPGLPGERPVKPSRLTFLTTLIRAGRFASPSWAVVIDAADNRRYRANGQHSSAMLASLPSEQFPTGLLATVTEYTTTNFGEDAFTIFEIFDNPRSVRNNTDKMSQFRVLYPELATVKLELLVALANGLAHYEDQRQGGVVFPPRTRGRYFDRPEVREFALWTAAYETSRHGWMLSKAGVVAEMFTEIQADRPAAQQFWDLTFTESHPDPDHESRELSRLLKELAPRPKVGQERLQKEAAKFWKRYRRSLAVVAVAA